MVKVSVDRFVLNRVETIRNEVEAEVHKLQIKTNIQLEEIFKVAAKVGKAQIKHQRIDGKLVLISSISEEDGLPSPSKSW